MNGRVQSEWFFFSVCCCFRVFFFHVNKLHIQSHRNNRNVSFVTKNEKKRIKKGIAYLHQRVLGRLHVFLLFVCLFFSWQSSHTECLTAQFSRDMIGDLLIPLTLTTRGWMCACILYLYINSSSFLTLTILTRFTGTGTPDPSRLNLDASALLVW